MIAASLLLVLMTGIASPAPALPTNGTVGAAQEQATDLQTRFEELNAAYGKAALKFRISRRKARKARDQEELLAPHPSKEFASSKWDSLSPYPGP